LEPQGQNEVKGLEISLHAMDGSTSPKTIRLLGQVNRKQVSILLNTNSTHNFIDNKVVHADNPRASLQCNSSNGDKLHSEGLCRSVRIKCQDAEIVIDFHILPIGGCQMVLGVDWLQTLDELTLNFKN